MVGGREHPPAGGHPGRRRRAVLLRPALLGRWLRLRSVRNLLVPADRLWPLLAVPHRLLRTADVGRRRMGPQRRLWLRPGPVVRGARAGVAQAPARRAAPLGHHASTATTD